MQNPQRNLPTLVRSALLSGLLFSLPANAENWPRYRGPEGAGSSSDKNVPTSWDDKKNIRWKADMPGGGNSSVIVWGDRALVVCYSGYGLDKNNPGNINNLTRHVISLDANTGKQIWTTDIKAAMPEDEYRGFITEHGYASSTPVTDGKHVYAFLGKTGAAAFDFKTGKQLWLVNLGKESGNRRWGSAASPILHGDHLIVTASEESQSVRALDKATGKEVWKAEGSVLELVYSTPLVVDAGNGRKDLVVSAVNEVWGLNPANGKLRWLAETRVPGNVSPCVTHHNGLIYTFGGYPRRVAAAIKVGGKGDITESHIAWTSNNSPYVPTPVHHEGHFYWVSREGMVNCISAKTGENVYQERLTSKKRGPKFYAAPVIANGVIYAVSRNAGTFVIKAGTDFKQIGQNMMSDNSDFSGTPAISNNRLFLRSYDAVYCIGSTDQVKANSNQALAAK